MTTPTQTAHPWRSTARTFFQAAVALCSLIPLVIAGVYNADSTPAIVAQILAVTAGVNRVMAIPAVNDFIERFLPFLAAVPQNEGVSFYTEDEIKQLNTPYKGEHAGEWKGE